MNRVLAIVGTLLVIPAGYTDPQETGGAGGWVGTATSDLDMDSYDITNCDDIQVKGQYRDSALLTSTPAGTTQTIDWDEGNVQKLDLEDASGNVTITSSNENATAVYTLIIQQDGGGNNRTVTFPADWLFAGGTATYTLTVTATADAIDVVTCVAASASALYCTVSQDHK